MEVHMTIGIHGCDHKYRIEAAGIDSKFVGSPELEQAFIAEAEKKHEADEPDCPAAIQHKAQQN